MENNILWPTRWTTRKLSLTMVVLLVLVAESAASKIVNSFTDDMIFDDNDRLLKHAMVYVDSPACTREEVPQMRHAHHDSFALEGAARDKVFPTKLTEDEDYCQFACIERGVDRSLVGDIMPTKIFDPTTAEETDARRWFEHTCNKVEICFINYHDRENTISTHWVNFEGKAQPHLKDIEYGERGTKCFISFMGHKFEVWDKDDNFLTKFEVGFVGVKAFGTSPPNEHKDPNYTVEDEIKTTLKHEWTRHNRVTRTFSPLGFKLGRLPPDVFASMGAFYYNNRNNVVHEEWGGKGVFVNWWETDVKFVQIPWTLKNVWQIRLLTLVEEWAGVPVEQTVMYGLRQYTEGARLLTHVDRHETHAVSLIVNVAQGNLTQPWPVEVQDHQDRLHEVIMEPGDIVYYESAKCLHARNRPMVGPNAYYVNLFTHYKPVTDLEWWHQPNHEGTPEAVLEMEGECKLVKSTSDPGIGGLYTSVQCEDERLGSHLSPSLFKASNADDMIQWWTETAHDYKRESDVSYDTAAVEEESETEPEEAPTPFVVIETPSRDEL